MAEHDPVLLHTGPGVELLLDPSVPKCRPRANNLNHQVRRSLDVLLLDDRHPLVGNVENVGLNDVEIGQKQVAGSMEDLAQIPLGHVVVEKASELS